MNNRYDVCVIGGGASGLAVAVYIKQKNRSISVAVLERLNRVGKKLITTGNGRCNITNRDESMSHFHGENADFSRYTIGKYDNKAIEQFFCSIGVPIIYDESGRGYPASLQASSVVDALRFSAETLGVDIYTECMVNDVSGENGVYSVKTGKGIFVSENIIFAAGLYSGGARLGCDGAVLKMLKSKGLKTVNTTPAIVQIKTENAVARSLKGIKVNAKATLIIDGKVSRSEVGEVLFCDYGLSGPPILQIAREVERQRGKKAVLLDLIPEKSTEETEIMLTLLKTNLAYRNLDEYLSGALNKRIGQAIIKIAGLKLSSPVLSLSKNDITKIAEIIKCFKFDVISTTGFGNSQVTAGGLDTTAFKENTMMLKSQKGIYAVGEILDVDGDCGGYNLHFAFSSAFCAADDILRNYGND